MANVFIPKKSTTSGAVPTTSNLAAGEIAVNFADGIIYGRDTSNNIVVLSDAERKVVSKTANYTATNSDFAILCDATSAAFTITLPTTGIRAGKRYLIKKTDSSAYAISISATVDGSATRSLPNQYDSLLVMFDGSSFHVIGGTISASLYLA